MSRHAFAAFLMVMTSACASSGSHSGSAVKGSGAAGPSFSARITSADFKTVALGFGTEQIGNGGSATVHTIASGIVISASTFNMSDVVHVVVLDYMIGANGSNDLIDTQQVDLAYTGHQRFEGPLPQGVTIHGFEDGHEQSYRQEIAVQVNGQWLTDPVNGSHNFKLDLNQAALAQGG